VTRRLLLSSLLAGALACGHAAPAAPDRATLILVGGDVVTNLPDRPRVTAVAIRGARILAIGDDAEVRRGLPDARCRPAGAR
jgi:hypothetical protein